MIKLLSVALSAIVWTMPAWSAGKVKIAVTQIVEHPALDAAYRGIKDELVMLGYDVEWIHESAQGNIANTVTIAKKFVGIRPDVIVSIATPSAQAIAAQNKRTQIPHVFSAVTDPVGAKLVTNLTKPEGFTTGVSDLSPMRLHVAMMQNILPSLKTLGVMYNASEANSLTLVKLLEAITQDAGIKLIKVSVTKSSEVAAGSKSLVGKVDAIYVPTDNTIISAFESVVGTAQKHDIALFSGDTDSVKRGAIAALGFNYYDVGRQTGRVVSRILKGESAGGIAVELPNKLEFFVNLDAAKKSNVVLSPFLVSLAKEVVH